MAFQGEIVEGRYLADLLGQPQALADTLRHLRSSNAFEAIARLRVSSTFERVVLTGMGSSFFALHPLSIHLAAQGYSPILLETSELIHFYDRLLTPSTLLIAVSQSGQSAETVRLLELNAGRAAVIGVTNNPSGALAARSHVAVLTEAGAEFSVSCKTYVSTLMALEATGAAVCGLDVSESLASLEPAARSVEEYLSGWKDHVSEFCEVLREVKDIFLVGRGPSLAAALTGSLILKEAAHFHAEGMSSAAFRHGPFEMPGPGCLIGVFAGVESTRALNAGLVHDLDLTGSAVLSISSDSTRACCRLPKVPERLLPFMEILPAQMMTLALSALASREAGLFRRASKVTATE